MPLVPPSTPLLLDPPTTDIHRGGPVHMYSISMMKMFGADAISLASAEQSITQGTGRPL